MGPERRDAFYVVSLVHTRRTHRLKVNINGQIMDLRSFQWPWTLQTNRHFMKLACLKILLCVESKIFILELYKTNLCTNCSWRVVLNRIRISKAFGVTSTKLGIYTLLYYTVWILQDSQFHFINLVSQFDIPTYIINYKPRYLKKNTKQHQKQLIEWTHLKN